MDNFLIVFYIMATIVSVFAIFVALVPKNNKLNNFAMILISVEIILYAFSFMIPLRLNDLNIYKKLFLFILTFVVFWVSMLWMAQAIFISRVKEAIAKIISEDYTIYYNNKKINLDINDVKKLIKKNDFSVDDEKKGVFITRRIKLSEIEKDISKGYLVYVNESEVDATYIKIDTLFTKFDCSIDDEKQKIIFTQKQEEKTF